MQAQFGAVLGESADACQQLEITALAWDEAVWREATSASDKHRDGGIAARPARCVPRTSQSRDRQRLLRNESQQRRDRLCGGGQR